jgi:hypothetical protein
MKTDRGSEGVASHILNLGSGWRWVISFTSRLLYPKGKETLVPIWYEAGWAPWESVREEKILLPLTEIEARFIDCPARSLICISLSRPGSCQFIRERRNLMFVEYQNRPAECNFDKWRSRHSISDSFDLSSKIWGLMARKIHIVVSWVMSSSLARQSYVDPDLLQKLPPVTGRLLLFQFLWQFFFPGWSCSPTSNPQLYWRTNVFCQRCLS